MNKKYKFFLIFILLGILLSCGVSFAADNSSSIFDDSNYHVDDFNYGESELKDNTIDYNSSNTFDVEDDVKESHLDNNKTAIKNAQSNNGINNYYQLEDYIKDYPGRTVNLQPITYWVDNRINIFNNTIINGNGATIDGCSKDEFIYLDSHKLTINNLTITNFRTFQEAVITTSNQATHLEMNNCTFTNIKGQTNGGAILCQNNLTLRNCIFENNMAIYGSAVKSFGHYGTVIIENCTFRNNPVGTGEIVYTSEKVNRERDSILHFTGGQSIVVNKCTFSNNAGRCIHNYMNGHLTITNNNFINMNKRYTSDNSSLGSIITNYEAKVFIYHNTFKNISITAPRIGGGFIYNEDSTFEMLNNTFTNITLTQNGKGSRIAGGILWNRNASAVVQNNTFNLTTVSYNLYGAATYNNIGWLSFLYNKVILNVTAENEVGGAAVYNDNDEQLGIASRLLLGDNSFGQITISPNAIILNKTVRSKGFLELTGLEDTDTLIRTAIMTLRAPSSIVTGKKAQFIIKVTDDSTHSPINGTAIVKIDGLTLKDEHGSIIKVKVKNGTGILDYFLTGYSARKYNITAVFSKSGYNRSEAHAKMTVNRSTYRFTPFTINGTSEMVITINTTVRDFNWNPVVGNNNVAIKIMSKTILSTKVTNGTLYAKVRLPYLPAGILNVTFMFGKNNRYEFLQVYSKANISKQSVVIDIKNVTAKAGSTVTLSATLKNYLTKTNVISGKYIFKVDTVTLPLIKDNKKVYTSKQVSGGWAVWNYTIPLKTKVGDHLITVSYNGNSQSNPAKHSAWLLRVVK
ncbi:MAG: hypothetical protein BZ137_09300 [Methanosphaera sp. rholeuAM130]|nr:MAG: hypothetical protein BZ137_09300 [Methanosphaera sp. rholeuAM130]